MRPGATPIHFENETFMITIHLPRALRVPLYALFALIVGSAVQAHEKSVGDIDIVHPYATPSVPGARNGAAYVATLENTGKVPDRLLHVSTPVAASAEIHTMSMDAGVMRMREVDAIDIAPGAPIKMRPGMGYHFMLMDLKRPLKEGDSFPMTLQFEHAGLVDVKVVVQVPTAHAAETGGHMH
jgi:periplasmic copper chaperone A